jgi:ABC-type transport system involved in cytochrome bd biosynthesis fused ATPase/permease subunit
MNTAYIRFCASLLAVVCMAMLAGAGAASTGRASWIWPAAILAVLLTIAGTTYLADKYRSAMLATEKAYAQIERLERQLDQVMKYRRHRSAEEWPSGIEG